MSKQKFYSLKRILERNAQYNMIIGERSNGKTYAVLQYAIEQYHANGGQLAIVRRMAEDFTGKRGTVMFDGLVANGEVERITGGKWTEVYYRGSKWYLSTHDGDGNRVTDEQPFAYGFSISAMEHDKSTAYPYIRTVMFDEFLSRGLYLRDEFILFMNVLSTIIRHRTDVKIFMLGNTVNKYSPYFAEMGITHIKDMKPGDIDVYRYGESGLTVAVEYTATTAKGKKSDLYFAFDNPKLNMVTKGTWEIDIYPHCPVKYSPGEVLFTYFIEWDSDLLQCEIIAHEDMIFTFVHRKTTPLKEPDKDLIYSPRIDARPNWKRKINRPTSTIEQRIADFYRKDKVFYQDNEVGEVVRNYLQWCGKV